MESTAVTSNNDNDDNDALTTEPQTAQSATTPNNINNYGTMKRVDLSYCFTSKDIIATYVYSITRNSISNIYIGISSASTTATTRRGVETVSRGMDKLKLYNMKGMAGIKV